MKNIILSLFLSVVVLQLTAQKKALTFDGSTNYLDCTENAVILGNNFTQEAWIYVEDVTKNYQLILGSAFGAGSDNRPPSLYLLNTTGLHFGFTGTDNIWYPTDLTGDYLTKSEWNHCALTFDGSYYRVYINGVKIDFADSAFAQNQTPKSLPVRGIGAANSNNGFNGKLDEVRMWSSVRTLAEIRDGMNRTYLPTYPTELVSYYKFDDGTGSSTANEIGGIPDATIMGTATWEDSDAFNTWRGTSSDWGTASNWSQNKLPDSTDNVGIYDDATNDPLVSSLAVDVNSVIMGTATSLAVDLESVMVTENHYSSTAAAITIDGELNVENTLQLEGEIEGEGYVYAGEYLLGPQATVFGLTPAFGGAAGGTWVATGSGSIDWFTDANWNQGVPKSSTSVLIDLNENPAFWPEIINDDAVCKRLSLYGQGANLVVGSSGTLTVERPGNANGRADIVEGNFIINGGTLTIRNITIDQGNLTIQNSGSVQVNEDVDVLPGGELNLESGGTMTIGQ